MAVDFQQAGTLVELLQMHASAQPDKVVFRFLADGEADDFQSLTYGELDRRARAIAAELQQVGQPGDRALMLYHSGLDFLSAFFACLYAKRIAVPAYPPRKNRKISRIQSIVEDCRPSVVMSASHVKRIAEPLFEDTFNGGWQQQQGLEMAWLVSDEVMDARADDYQALTIEPETITFLQYTSGSTGNPKGVMVSHDNLIYNERMINAVLNMQSSDTMISWLPLFHDMGLIGAALQPLFCGADAVLMPPAAFLQRPHRWLQAISDFKGTITVAPNFAYELCTNQISDEQREKLDLSSLRMAMSGAEPVRQDTMERFTERFTEKGFSYNVFSPTYGMAETTLLVSGSHDHTPPLCQTVDAEALLNNRAEPVDHSDKPTNTLVGVGVTDWLEQEVLIVDPESRQVLEEGHVGEIWVAGRLVAEGYWNRPELTEEIFAARTADGRGPFLRTGDLGCFLGKELVITGRAKDVIIVRGMNHYPQDIEFSVCQSHEALKPDCTAVFTLDAGQGEQLIVVQEVERSKRMSMDTDEVFTSIRQAVSELHELQVSAIVLLKPGRILKTSSGKIQRSACRQAFLEGDLDPIAEWRANDLKTDNLEGGGAENRLPPVPPVDIQQASIEQWIVDWVAYKLDLADTTILDPAASFTSYGMDSVDAVQLVGALEGWLELSLDATVIWDFDTVKALSGYLESVYRDPTLLQADNTSDDEEEIEGAL